MAVRHGGRTPPCPLGIQGRVQPGMDRWMPRLQDSGSGAGHPKRGRNRCGLINQERVQKTVDRYTYIIMFTTQLSFTEEM